MYCFFLISCFQKIFAFQVSFGHLKTYYKNIQLEPNMLLGLRVDEKYYIANACQESEIVLQFRTNKARPLGNWHFLRLSNTH